jgi:hypothetical protein
MMMMTMMVMMMMMMMMLLTMMKRMMTMSDLWPVVGRGVDVGCEAQLVQHTLLPRQHQTLQHTHQNTTNNVS